MSIDLEQAKMRYLEHFGRAAEYGGRAPGRVNLIGEHTDYNHGFVLPMAIERDTVVLGAVRDDSVLQVFAANLHDAAEIDLSNPTRSADHPWADYVAGVAHLLLDGGYELRGADLLILGDVPLGCGLSSSASLEVAALSLFECMNGFELSGPDAARLCQRVENEFLVLSTGIMDQFVARLGEKDRALFVDCRTLAYESIEVQLPHTCFVIADTGVPRALVESKYNERVEECRRAVKALQTHTGKCGTHLRDFSLSDLEGIEPLLAGDELQRALHVMSEDTRTRLACEALRHGNLSSLGMAMDDSDRSLDERYGVVSDELRTMTSIARKLDGCYGSRMTGAGFGGCTISLVERAQADNFCTELKARYEQRCAYTCTTIVSSPAAGADSFRL